MNIKLLSLRGLQFVTILSISIFTFSCGSNDGKKDGENADSTVVDSTGTEDFSKAKQVFYSLPSPIETAMLMKRAGAKYDESILNSIENTSKYTTTISRSLNLGVYSADLSFASMFDQSQATLNYIAATKKLADQLGMLTAIPKTIIDRMESNINNRDSLMEIISETFMNSNSLLKEDGRSEIAAIVLVGGWVEGLYIATKIAKTTKSNDELVTRIIDQRLSLSTLMSLLDEYKDDENIAKLITELKNLEKVFEKIKITSSKIEPVTDSKTKVTTLKAKTETSISPEVFENLCNKVAEFRNNIIK